MDQPLPEPPQFDVVTVPVSKDKSFSTDLPILFHDPAEEMQERKNVGSMSLRC